MGDVDERLRYLDECLINGIIRNHKTFSGGHSRPSMHSKLNPIIPQLKISYINIF